MSKEFNDVRAVFVCNLSPEQPTPSTQNCQEVLDALDCLKVARELIKLSFSQDTFDENECVHHENESVKHTGGVNSAYSINML